MSAAARVDDRPLVKQTMSDMPTSESVAAESDKDVITGLKDNKAARTALARVLIVIPCRDCDFL